jgi:hypothetical protein
MVADGVLILTALGFLLAIAPEAYLTVPSANFIASLPVPFLGS